MTEKERGIRASSSLASNCRSTYGGTSIHGMLSCPPDLDTFVPVEHVTITSEWASGTMQKRRRLGTTIRRPFTPFDANATCVMGGSR